MDKTTPIYNLITVPLINSSSQQLHVASYRNEDTVNIMCVIILYMS